ncbi:MAG: hypothetical protein NTW39_06145 [Actinobacteria bacterium]|jgi:hypothetical protein|nr:hypothetical protein [Actinomycetota bacterium]
MKLTKTKKEIMKNSAEKDWKEISRLRMEFAENNPDIIEKMFRGDPSAIEAFTNFGGINAKVTSVIRRNTP